MIDTAGSEFCAVTTEIIPKIGTVRFTANGDEQRPQERYGKDGWKPFCCDHCGEFDENEVPFDTCPKCEADYTVKLMVGDRK